MTGERERAPVGCTGARTNIASGGGPEKQSQHTPRPYPAAYMAVRRTLPKTPERKINWTRAYPGNSATDTVVVSEEEFAEKIAELVAAELHGTDR